MPSLEQRVAVDAARAAGRLLLDALPGSHRITTKSTARDLVTEMDTRAEALIFAQLRSAFPDDAMLGEESGATQGPSGRRWIVDPLDGTVNYAHGVPHFAVSIALETRGRVELGVAYLPCTDELYVAERGGGAWLNERRLSVSATATLDASLLVTGFSYDIREESDNNLREYALLSVRARAVRRLGAAVADLAWVAAGRFDAFWELRLGPWDVAAGMLLVEEAGGRVTGIDGGPLNLEAPSLVASNGRIHAEILATLKEIR